MKTILRTNITPRSFVWQGSVSVFGSKMQDTLSTSVGIRSVVFFHRGTGMCECNGCGAWSETWEEYRSSNFSFGW